MAASTSVFLNVHDIERSLAFYQALGFRVTDRYEHEGRLAYADLDYQGAPLGLGSIGSNDDPEFRAWVSTPLGAGALVSFSVPDVDRIHEKAKASGATIEFPPADRPYGRVLGLNDPDGYVVQFIREPRAARAPRKGAAKRARKAARKTPARKAGAKKAAKGTKKARKAKARR